MDTVDVVYQTLGAVSLICMGYMARVMWPHYLAPMLLAIMVISSMTIVHVTRTPSEQYVPFGTLLRLYFESERPKRQHKPMAG
jgi:hypothetical protein